jgi:hypothetical protein
MKRTPFRLKQQLSPKASAAKKARDLKAANSPARKKKRADSQKKRRSALKRGKNLSGLDYDHRTSSFKSVKYNRGNNGKGTKREG